MCKCVRLLSRKRNKNAEPLLAHLACLALFLGPEFYYCYTRWRTHTCFVSTVTQLYIVFWPVAVPPAPRQRRVARAKCYFSRRGAFRLSAPRREKDAGPSEAPFRTAHSPISV